MKFQGVSSCSLLLLMLCAGPALAQHGVFTSKTAFQSATSGYASSSENFDGFANGQQITSLFNGLVHFDSPSPTDFYGHWNTYGTAGQFSGGSLIPEPRFAGRSLVLLFDSPVFGLGANVFDDFDGINVQALTVTTAAGNKISVTENFANVGDTGFLGVTSPDGIVRAEFSVDSTNGTLEIDHLIVARMQPPASPGCSTSADCASGQACSSGTCVAACSMNTWTDLSGNGHHGTLLNFAGTSASGWMGTGTPADPYALHFDGQNDYVQLAAASDGLRFTDELTLEMWAYHDQTPGMAQQMFTNRDNPWVYSGIVLQPHWNYFYAPTSSAWDVKGTPATVGVWNHAVATYSLSSGLYRLFINGVEKVSGLAQVPIYYGPGALPRIGADDGGTYPYLGRIALVRMWSSALTQAEITELYRKNASRFGLTAPAPAGLTLPAPKAHYEACRLSQ